MGPVGVSEWASVQRVPKKEKDVDDSSPGVVARDAGLPLGGGWFELSAVQKK